MSKERDLPGILRSGAPPIKPRPVAYRISTLASSEGERPRGRKRKGEEHRESSPCAGSPEGKTAAQAATLRRRAEWRKWKSHRLVRQDERLSEAVYNVRGMRMLERLVRD